MTIKNPNLAYPGTTYGKIKSLSGQSIIQDGYIDVHHGTGTTNFNLFINYYIGGAGAIVQYGISAVDTQYCKIGLVSVNGYTLEAVTNGTIITWCGIVMW